MLLSSCDGLSFVSLFWGTGDGLKLGGGGTCCGEWRGADFVDKASRKSINKGAKAKKKRKDSIAFFSGASFFFCFFLLVRFDWVTGLGLRFDVSRRIISKSPGSGCP
jgi:hypothetical protein